TLSGEIQATGVKVQHSLVAVVPDLHEDLHDEIYDREDHPSGDNDTLVEEIMQVDFTKLIERQKKMFELRLKTNEARKANQTAMVAEKKRMEAPPESKGVSKEKWIEERKKKIGKLLDANGLDMTKAYMLVNKG
ncbi:pre-mRNA-splicing factor syf2-like, partial [Camellia sinensis]|uniref:pre-mRNA-splicing factor syf2-like n=1 Tax=Camellia sinensis TaxID=4442 RepID=UPI0010361B98